ncbi:PAS domain S-box-containing protein [Bosea sp. BK604]|nr:PAS domain S-box-containing protein [Bosea sp. BK604]
MIVVPPQKLAFLIVVSAAGIAVSSLTGTMCGLLVPIAALFLCVRDRGVLFLNLALAIGFAGSLLMTYVGAGAIVTLSWPAFFAVALCIGAIVTTRVSASRDVGTAGLATQSPSDKGTSRPAAARASFDETTAADVVSSLNLIHPEDRQAAAHAAARAFWTGVPQVTRHRRRQSDGSYRWTETRSEPGYVVSVDINDLVTEREPPRATASSRFVENEPEPMRSARVIESLFGDGWAFDADGRWIYLHPFAQSSLGMTLDDLNAPLEDGHAAWKKLLHPDDYDRVDDAWRHCLQTGDHFNVEFRFRRVTGGYVWARAAARPTRDEQGRITGWYGIALDVDVYKRTVAALRDRERELSHLVDMVPSLIWRLAPDGEPIFFNKRMVNFLGLDVVGTDKPGVTRLAAFIERAVHPEDAALLRKTLSSCLITGDSFDLRYRLRRADGVYRWMSSRAEPMRDDARRIVQWYGLCHDIDGQMHAEEALRKSERQLQQLVDAVPASIWCTARDGTPLYRNKRHANTTGASLKDFTVTGGYSSPLAAMAHPDDRAAAEQVRASAFESGRSYVVRYRQIRSDGTYRWTESRAEPLRDESGEVLRWYGVSVDVHDLVTAQEALQRSERELSQLVNLLPVHIRRLSPEGETMFFNKRLVDFVGLDLAELDKLGMSGLAGTVQVLVHPDDAASLKETISHALATGESYANRYRVRRADGVYRWMEGRGEPVRDQHGAILQWYGISIDIDGEVRAQEELRLARDAVARASQAASLAELSASIAHEVNQPLAAIVANSHACQRWLKTEPPNLERAQTTVERVIRDANSAADVVGRIRALFKQSVEPRNYTAFDGVIDEARNLMADEAARRRIRMTIDVERNLPPIAFDRVQIQQVLINLIRNGFDAMDSVAGEKALELRVHRIGDVVRTEIRDRGVGIESSEKIFDPFFTTKEHGMGMGLAICRSIVESHGGQLWTEKNQPNGAVFIFTLLIGQA